MSSKTRREYRLLKAAYEAHMVRDITPIFYAPQVDMATTNRLADWGREHLASLTPERRAELERGE